MSTVPEVIAAASLIKASEPVHVAALSCVTNKAAQSGVPLSHEEGQEVVGQTMKQASKVFLRFIEHVGEGISSPY